MDLKEFKKLKKIDMIRAYKQLTIAKERAVRQREQLRDTLIDMDKITSGSMILNVVLIIFLFFIVVIL